MENGRQEATTTRGCSRESVVVDVFGKPLEFGTPDNSKPASGHCCRCLTLQWTLADFDAAYKAAVAGEHTFVRPGSRTKPLSRFAKILTWLRLKRPESNDRVMVMPDALTIGPMLRKVGVCDANPLTGGPFPEPRKVFRCVHNRDDFSCAIYDRRPQMCRTYPHNAPDGKCEYTSCQSEVCECKPAS